MVPFPSESFFSHLPVAHFPVSFFTTDGTIGPISSSNIQSWSVTVSGPVTGPEGQVLAQSETVAFQAETGSAIYVDPGALTATQTQLVLAESAGPGGGSSVFFLDATGGDVEYENPIGYGGEGYDYAYSVNGIVGKINWGQGGTILPPPYLNSGSEPWVIAQTAAVPEPSAIMLLCAGGVALLVYRWRKNYRR